jgi:molybdopterin-containing oxidoreductase family membrane subunit
MGNNTVTLTALFREDIRAAQAIRDLASPSWRVERVCGPVPSEAIHQALHGKKTPVGWFTLVGGLLGLVTGYGFASFTSLRWGLIVSGKPVVALVPFLIVGFELAVLFAVFGTVIGLILHARLPAFGDEEDTPEECTADRFGLVLQCPEGESAELQEFLEERGAWVRRQ